MKLIFCVIWSVLLVGSLSRSFSQVEAKIDELRSLLLDFENEIHEDEYDVQQWFREVDENLRLIYHEQAVAEWNFETNINNETSAKKVAAGMKASEVVKDVALEARQKMKSLLLKKNTRRRLRILGQFSDPTDKNKLEQLEETKSQLENIYSTATLTKDGKVSNLEPEITDIMSDQRDPDVLLWAWKGWRDATGKKMRSLYSGFVRLSNMGAVENGYSDYGAAWREEQFEHTPDLMDMSEKLWRDISPLYIKLHAFVRMRLRDYYAKHFPDYDFPTDGTIPAHLLGDMWAQEWEGIYKFVKPYPDVNETDVTEEMTKQNYDVQKLFRMAEEFYTSLGLDPMTDTFWEKSMFTRPNNRDVQCHASASDFYSKERNENKDDFRIKMCTEIDASYFNIIHHEMGHIQYFMEYRHQPTVFRNGANSAFHEAIGDTISLSVQTQKHLEAVGLIPRDQTRNLDDERKRDMNLLMKQALSKIVFLPFGYLVDIWRFKVFDGTISEPDYNKAWWELRLKYQGLSAPVKRTSEDFDPGAKFHIPSNSPYICYFISFIVQFQFYESLCKESGHTGPLHTCDYYQSKDAGSKLRSFLQLGLSLPWKDAMKVLTGTTEIKTDAIKNYFRPLSEWLDNEFYGEKLGWEGAKINFE